jgi:thymidylate kinase
VRSAGQLFVFEGPDGVGKSELSQRFSSLLRSRGVPVQLLTFPGKDDGTLGKVVYDLHHEPGRFGVNGIAPSSMQLLHIAAHLDTIERTILPALRAGTTIVLDRFWWSTKVYGIASGVNPRTLDAMIAVELAAWGSVKPTQLFLVTRRSPLRPEPEELWKKWKELYDDLASVERRSIPLSVVENESSVETALADILDKLEAAAGQKYAEGSPQLGLEFPGEEKSERVPYVFCGIEPAKPSLVYDTYWRFAAERQAVFFNRWRGLLPPWTGDQILQEYKFTNAYRASDRVSQYLIREVIYGGDQSPEELFFRIILFKFFNKTETWELLKNALGSVSYRDYDYRVYDRLLLNAIIKGERIYSAAYIMPSGSSTFGTTRKHRANLKLLRQMMDDEVPLKIAQCRSMFEAFKILRSYPMLGDFLAYQYVTDVNYSTLTNFSEMEFVVPGPGAKGGISKCFESLGGLSEADIIRVVTDRQTQEFERLGLDFQSLWGRPLQLIDCQNLFCEVDKYSRVKHPDYPGSSQRTKIKQKFRPNFEAVEYWYPPKWGLNEAIYRDKKERQR